MLRVAIKLTENLNGNLRKLKDFQCFQNGRNTALGSLSTTPVLCSHKGVCWVCSRAEVSTPLPVGQIQPTVNLGPTDTNQETFSLTSRCGRRIL